MTSCLGKNKICIEIHYILEPTHECGGSSIMLNIIFFYFRKLQILLVCLSPCRFGHPQGDKTSGLKFKELIKREEGVSTPLPPPIPRLPHTIDPPFETIFIPILCKADVHPIPYPESTGKNFPTDLARSFLWAVEGEMRRPRVEKCTKKAGGGF